MTTSKVFAVVLFFLSWGCLAGEFGTSDKVFLADGACGYPLAIKLATTATIDGQNFDFFDFSEECKALGVDKRLFDAPPASFACRSGGKTPLSGATYKKIRDVVIKSQNEDLVDTRVYVYQCIKACTQSPKKIEYAIVDCG